MKSDSEILNLLKIANKEKVDATKLDIELINRVVCDKKLLEKESNAKDKQRMKLYKKGLTDGEIAEQLNISRHCVANWRNKKGLISKNENKYKFTDEELIKYHNNGLINVEIARKLNVTSEAITFRIKKLGLERNKKNNKVVQVDEEISENLSDNKLLELYLLNKSDREIARLYKLSSQRIGERRRSMKLKSKYKTIRKFTNEELIELIENGKSDSEIARELKVAKSTVYQRRKKLDLDYNKDARGHKEKNINKSTFKEKWEEGLSDREIADFFGIKIWEAFNLRKKLNLPSKIKNKLKNKRKFTDHELIISWCDQKNDREIAIKYGCNVSAVWSRRKKLGLPSQDEVKWNRIFNFGLPIKKVRKKTSKKASDIEIVESYCNGQSIRQIAEKYNCTETPIYNRLKFLCVIKKKRGMLKDSEIYKLFNKNKTDIEIAEITGYSDQTIKKRRLKLGLRRKRSNYIIY